MIQAPATWGHGILEVAEVWQQLCTKDIQQFKRFCSVERPFESRGIHFADGFHPCILDLPDQCLKVVGKDIWHRKNDPFGQLLSVARVKIPISSFGLLAVHQNFPFLPHHPIEAFHQVGAITKEFLQLLAVGEEMFG